MLAAAETATALDVLQTLDLRHHPEFYESNALLGSSPSVGRVLALGGAGMVLEGVLWWLLPPPWRTAWAGGAGGFEVAVIAHHVRLGLRF